MNLNALRAIVGDAHLSVSPEDRAVYGRDASRLRGECLAVVWPGRAEAVQSLVAWAVAEGVDLVPRGAGTGLCGGATPQRSVVVDLSRMTGIHPMEEQERAIRVEAGVTLDALNRRLAPQGLFLPVIPGSHRAASLGGMIATDAAGLRAVRYSTMRAWVESLTLVDGQGRLHQINGERLDDVAGREGVTGFVVEAALRLAPLPRRRTVTLLAFDRPDDLLAQAARWLESPHLTALEYINRPAAEMLGWEAQAHLLAEFDSDEGQTADPQRIAEVWRARDGLYPVLARRGHPLIEDPRLERREALAEMLAWLESERIPAFGHLGVGIVHPCFAPDDPRVAQLYRRVAAWGGTVSGEHGIGLKKKPYTDEAFRDEIRRLKAVYDPEGVFNRGKLC